MKQPEEQDSLEALLDRARPRLGRVLARYNIPPDDAEDLLRDVFLTLIFQRDRVSEPEVWVLRTLKQQCLAYWRRRRRVLYSNLDAELRQSVLETGGDSKRRERLRRQLARVVDSLPAPCRSLLRRRYGLDGALGPDPLDDTVAGEVSQRCLAALGKRLMESGVLDDLDPPQ
ncbi:MAG: sigma-70 family RNA polymerase sigma factor [Acidobacteriota bacterium]|nr:sigma-70 family RNA polymerase sigma factor [Acidobacteriota bacterium]